MGRRSDRLNRVLNHNFQDVAFPLFSGVFLTVVLVVLIFNILE